MNRYLLLGLSLTLISSVCFGLHYFVLNSAELGDWGWIGTNFSLLGMYTFCAIASLVMLIVLFLIDFSMPKQVGFGFLVGMTLKAVASYFYIADGVNLSEHDFIELNFLVVFFVYLLFDAFVPYYTVNQEEAEKLG